MEDLTDTANKPTTTTVRKKRQPNFVKSNSLGLLVTANTHSYHGPATINSEGGWHGEHKIQQVKPLLHIKQSNECLVVANTHSYHGPATINSEGGWHGEQKIQQVKPLLHIKQSNADWQTITLHTFLSWSRHVKLGRGLAWRA